MGTLSPKEYFTPHANLRPVAIGADPLPSRLVSEAWIYFIQADIGGLIKIGYAADIPKRLNAMQMGCPVQLVVLAQCRGTGTYERELHQRFAGHRRHGEWFEPVPELLELIASLRR